jgi:hypothetical protein
MISYETAKALKEAGFPQKYKQTKPWADFAYLEGELHLLHEDNDTGRWIGNDYGELYDVTVEYVQEHAVKAPTLEELLTECLNTFYQYDYVLREHYTKGDDNWIFGEFAHMEHEYIDYSTGETPEETVALFLIKLYEKRRKNKTS